MPHRFVRLRRAEQPVRFVTVMEAFKPQVRVMATRDLSGWVNRDRRVKFHIGKGRIGFLDHDTARQFQVKGYVEILDGTVKPVSEDEAAEILSTVTVISLGGSNG